MIACSLAAAVEADTRTHLQYQSEEAASCHREYLVILKPCGGRS